MNDPKHVGYVAIVGRPNVGKSSLLNRLLGQRLAITAPKPQTTRHNLLGIQTRDDGQILYVDTPGIHQRQDTALNRYLNRAAHSVLGDVHLVLFVVEALRWTAEDVAVWQRLEQLEVPNFLVINKVDRVRPKELLLPFMQQMAALSHWEEILPVSARHGEGVRAMEDLIMRCLPEGQPFFPEDQITDRPERFFAAELLREQLIRHYGAELPYQVSVEIETFEERNDSYHIRTLVWVERVSQKAILIGHQGQAMKLTAQDARLRMEAFFEKKVYLEVWVRVRNSWSNDEAALARLGYSD